MSRFSLTNVAAYLLNLVDARIIDDINVIQMARCVYTVEHCDSGSQAAIRIHEGQACNFVFMCLHSLIRSRFRNRINSWFSGIFFQSPQMRVEPLVIFPAFRNWQFAELSTTKRQLWSSGFSAWLGGNMHLKGHSDYISRFCRCAPLILWSSMATKLVPKLAETTEVAHGTSWNIFHATSPWSIKSKSLNLFEI